MVLPILIALALIAGSLAFFRDDIRNIFDGKTEAQKEKERQDAKIRNDKGAFKNTADFLFGEGIPKTPEELQVEKKINERGAFANIQAFFFGEESLKASEKPPLLASGLNSEENTARRLELNQFESTALGRNNVFFNSKSRRTKNSKELLTIQTENKQTQQAGQQVGQAQDIRVTGAAPSERKENVIPKDERRGRNTFTQTTVVKEMSIASGVEKQKATQPSENKSNVITKGRRRQSNVRNPPRAPNTEIPVEQREDSVQIG